MDQIWVEYLDRRTKRIQIKKFWYADQVRRFIKYIKKRPREYQYVSSGGYQDAEEMQYAIGW